MDDVAGSMTRGGNASWILAIAAHVLALVAYLPVAVGLVIWPYFQGWHGEDFIVLATVFVPVALTGIALLTVLAARRNRDISILAARERVVPFLLVIMAGLAIYAFSQVYLPVWVKLVIGVAIGGMALGSLLTSGKTGRALTLWAAALLLLGFCALALASVGILFLPAALASLSLAIVFSFSRAVAAD